MTLHGFDSKLLYHCWINYLSVSSYLCLRVIKVLSLGNLIKLIYIIFF